MAWTWPTGSSPSSSGTARRAPCRARCSASWPPGSAPVSPSSARTTRRGPNPWPTWSTTLRSTCPGGWTSRRCRRCCGSPTARKPGRLEGWARRQWEAFTGVADLGPGLPDYRPGCGSRTLDPGVSDELMVRFGAPALRSRRVELADLEDEMEAMFDRGWTDGLPVVPPTETRVLRMLEGTARSAEDVVAVVPPDLVECTRGKSGGQRGHGRVPARVPPGGPGRGGGGVHRHLQRPRAARHDLVLRSDGRGQRAHPPGHRHELRASTPSARATGPTPPSAGPCSW